MPNKQASNGKVAALASLALAMWFGPIIALLIMRFSHFDLPNNHPAGKYLLVALVMDFILSAVLLIYLFKKFPQQMNAGVYFVKNKGILKAFRVIIMIFSGLMLLGIILSSFNKHKDDNPHRHAELTINPAMPDVSHLNAFG